MLCLDVCLLSCEIFIFVPVLLIYTVTDIQHHISLRHTARLLDLHTSWSDYYNRFSEHLSSHIHYLKNKIKFFLLMRNLRIYSQQLSYIIYGNVIFIMLNIILSIYLFYNWKFVPLNCLHLILLVPTPAPGKTNLIFFSMSLFASFLKYSWSTALQ